MFELPKVGLDLLRFLWTALPNPFLSFLPIMFLKKKKRKKKKGKKGGFNRTEGCGLTYDVSRKCVFCSLRQSDQDIKFQDLRDRRESTGGRAGHCLPQGVNKDGGLVFPSV